MEQAQLMGKRLQGARGSQGRLEGRQKGLKAEKRGHEYPATKGLMYVVLVVSKFCLGAVGSVGQAALNVPGHVRLRWSSLHAGQALGSAYSRVYWNCYRDLETNMRRKWMAAARKASITQQSLMVLLDIDLGLPKNGWSVDNVRSCDYASFARTVGRSYPSSWEALSICTRRHLIASPISALACLRPYSVIELWSVRQLAHSSLRAC